MSTHLRSLIIALVAIGVSSGLAAEESRDELRAYRAARILRVAGGGFAPGVIVVRGENVESVLPPGAELPPGADVVDLGDVWVLPGLVNPLSAISTRSYRGYSSGRASLRSANPRDARQAVGLARVDIRDALYRRLGMTPYTAIAILAEDRGSLIEGHASVIHPRRGTEEVARDLCLQEKAYLLINFASGKALHDAAVRTIKKAADDIIKEREEKKKAEAEAKKKAAEETKKKAEKGEKTPEKKEAEKKQPSTSGGGSSTQRTGTASTQQKPAPPDPLRLALEGKLRVFLRVSSPASLDHLHRFLDSVPLPLRFVLVTSSQPPEIVEKIAARRDRIHAVILEPTMGREWSTSIWVNTARLLLEKGMPVAFVPQSDTIEGFRDVLFHVAELVRGGLREEDALRALTVVPAWLLGLEKRIGSLEPGRAASFIIYDRHPLSGTGRLQRVFVAGSEVYVDDARTGELRGEAVR